MEANKDPVICIFQNNYPHSWWFLLKWFRGLQTLRKDLMVSSWGPRQCLQTFTEFIYGKALEKCVKSPAWLGTPSLRYKEHSLRLLSSIYSYNHFPSSFSPWLLRNGVKYPLLRKFKGSGSLAHYCCAIPPYLKPPALTLPKENLSRFQSTSRLSGHIEYTEQPVSNVGLFQNASFSSPLSPV